MDVKYCPSEIELEAKITCLQIEARRNGEWEPALEPSVVRISSRNRRIDLTISGDDSVDGQLGDGDCSSLRVNVSASTVHATAAITNLVTSALDVTIDMARENVIDQELIVRDNFFGESYKLRGETPGNSPMDSSLPPHLGSTKDALPPSEVSPMAIVIQVETLRISFLEGGLDDVPQNETLVATVKDAVAEFSVTRSRRRFNLCIEDAQIDS